MGTKSQGKYSVRVKSKKKYLRKKTLREIDRTVEEENILEKRVAIPSLGRGR